MTFQKELSCGMLYVNILRVGEDCPDPSFRWKPTSYRLHCAGGSPAFPVWGRTHQCHFFRAERNRAQGRGDLPLSGQKKPAAAYGCIVCCSGGFHVDHITEDQICELMSALDEVPLETYQKSQCPSLINPKDGLAFFMLSISLPSGYQAPCPRLRWTG